MYHLSFQPIPVTLDLTDHCAGLRPADAGPRNFAAMLTMVMAPVIDKLDSWGFKRIFSTITCLVFLFAVFGLVVVIMVEQVTSFREDLPEIEEKINSLINSAHQYVERNYEIP